MNILILKGRVVRPEWKDMSKDQSGMMALKFSICVDNEKRSKTGEVKIEKTYVGCIAWGKTGEPAKDIQEGQEIQVGGSLKQDSWEDKKNPPKKIYALSMIVQSIIFDKLLCKKIEVQEASPFEETPYDDLPF
jgi:single-stranded DNA-binding protein